MSTADLATATWRKSSLSGGGNNDACVEVAILPELVGVRDSKNRSAGHLEFSAAAWRRFTR